MLKVSNLVSGTKYRGEFEDRLNNIIKYIEKTKTQSYLLTKYTL